MKGWVQKKALVEVSRNKRRTEWLFRRWHISVSCFIQTGIPAPPGWVSVSTNIDLGMTQRFLVPEDSVSVEHSLLRHSIPYRCLPILKALVRCQKGLEDR